VTKPWFKAFVIAKASILDRLPVTLSAFMTWEWCGEALKKPEFARIKSIQIVTFRHLLVILSYYPDKGSRI
jgi:hypothetical protein